MTAGLESRAGEALAEGAGRITGDDIRGVLDSEGDVLETAAGSRHLSGFLEDLKLLFRMLADYAAGRYRKVPWNTVAATVTAFLYILNPLDLMPDFIPGIGYLDDGAVVALALKLVARDIGNYRSWRRGSPEDRAP
jgi:uncharacterized membrane protein YkvA (DUF1232 family)